MNNHESEEDREPDEPAPTPRIFRLLNLHEVDRHRRMDCKHYNRCLETANARHWEGFTCAYCKAHLPKTQQEIIQDDAKLMGLFEGIINPFRK